MKRFTHLTALTLLLCSLCACGGNDLASDNNTESAANPGSFSTEMIIEPSTDVIIVEMP